MNSSKDRAKKQYLPIITRKEDSKVPTSEIFYIEKELRRINVYTGDRVYTFYGKMESILHLLGENFYRCHGSCIINFDKVERMEDGIFYMEKGMSLRVGENNYQGARKYYRKYLQGDNEAPDELEEKDH